MSMKEIKTVGELRKALDGMPDVLPLGVSVYGHSYYAPMHGGSHGPLFIEEAVAKAGNGELGLILIHTGRELPQDGFCLARISSRFRITE